jgi:hypothetical protein
MSDNSLGDSYFTKIAFLECGFSITSSGGELFTTFKGITTVHASPKNSAALSQ